MEQVGQDTWSFSQQWQEFNVRRVTKTWCWSLAERYAMFFREVDLQPEELAEMDVLDAGCGNGQLTNEIGRVAKSVVGLDYSSSVDAAEQTKTFSNVSYRRGDLNNPPFPAASFDLVYSSGALHHNPDTRRTFDAVAGLVKPGGRFYVWLYRVEAKPIPLLTLALNEPVRWIVSRLPGRLQNLACRFHAALYHAVLSVLRPGKYTYNEHLIAAYDATASRWAHRHTPFELARWFHEAGFDSPKLTHWDNGGGFGMMAEKRMVGLPAGVNFKL